MAFGHKASKLVVVSALSCLFFLSNIFAAPPVLYASPMGEESWQMSGNPLRCGLSLMIPNYGIGYFEQYATKQPHFILRKWQQVQRALPAQVSARSPSWKPYGSSFVVARSFVKPGDYGLFLNREPTLKLLTYLAQGYQAQFNYISEEGFATTVALSPIRFQKVYSRYQHCLGNLLPFDFEQVQESVFHFDAESSVLTAADKAQLQRIAQYVAADEQIRRVQIIGYTDDRGRKGYNNAISQYRAEAVTRYLLSLGVSKKKLSTTWYGVLKPIARNDTDEGRAENRRVVVNLLKK